MNLHDCQNQKKRLAAYEKLTERRQKIVKALRALTDAWPHGPHGQGPFTGNMRESRQVEDIHIVFTPTLVGSPAVETDVFDLGIEAWDLGKFLEGKLREKLAVIDKEIEQI